MTRRLLKKIFARCVIAAVLFAVCLPAAVFATPFSRIPGSHAIVAASVVNLGEFVGTRNAPRRAAAMGLEITGSIPEARFGDNELNIELAERFTAQVNGFIQAHQASALSINFTTHVFGHRANPDCHLLVSIVITMEAVSATTTVAIATTVVNTYYDKIITLSQYNINATALVNNRIRTMIDANPRGFVPNFGGIDAEHPFYLNNGLLVIPFGSGGLIPTMRGVHTISLSTENISDVTIRTSQFYTLPAEQYSIRMVRLMTVMEHFGYEAEWDARTRTVEVFMDDLLVSALTIGENAYFYRSSNQRELEVAPALRHGRTYVPLSFFDEVMGMSATVIPDGYIIISRYTPTPLPEDVPPSEYAEDNR